MEDLSRGYPCGIEDKPLLLLLFWIDSYCCWLKNPLLLHVAIIKEYSCRK